jgi:hypothetical protein
MIKGPVTGNSGSSPERAMEINSLSVKDLTRQHSRKCEGRYGTE